MLLLFDSCVKVEQRLICEALLINRDQNTLELRVIVDNHVDQETSKTLHWSDNTTALWSYS